MKKLANHIILSGVTVSMLFSPLMAIDPNKLPSGGKFTHGTSGSISGPYFDKNTGKNTIDITGKTQGGNHVIQWGGGFSIGNKAQVNFIGNDQNYLNIAHGTDKSTIEGVLNAGGNNVFLINPNGVIITKTGTINANRFVASTSSMDSKSMQEFADGKLAYNTFSPVFKPHKAGNVVNMGNINANDVLLIGNKVLMQGYFNTKDKTFNQVTAKNIHLVGNEVHADLATFNDKANLAITAKDKGSLYLNATGYYYNPSFKNFKYEAKSYTNTQDELGNKITANHNNANFSNMKYVGIGSDIDWWHFAKGWNESEEFRTNVLGNTFKLTNDIDFKGNQGKGVEGKDWQNYANYCIDGLGCTNMIVGFKGDYYLEDSTRTFFRTTFTKNFDGQGYKLKNINMDITPDNIDNLLNGYIGIFGRADDATFKNINVDYMGGGIKAESFDFMLSVGGFVGHVRVGSFSNISLNNILDISATKQSIDIYMGGFAGRSNIGTFTNISLNNIGNIRASTLPYNYILSNVGGFIGEMKDGTFTNISLNNIGNIISSNREAGGFAGLIVDGAFTNISLNNIGNIINNNGGAGGFAGRIDSGTFTNISLNNIGNIRASNNLGDYAHAGGFTGSIDTNNGGDGVVHFEKIYIYFSPDSKIEVTGGKTIAGKFNGSSFFGPATFSNIHIYHHKNDLNNATADKSYWGNTDDKIQIHTYNDNNQESVYKDFLSKANTIEKPEKPTPPTNPDNPNDSDVILGSDDLYSDVIMEWIIKEIREKNYTISIEKLASLINAFKTLDKDSSEDEIKTIVKAHLGIKDDNEALSMAQSISFLLNYQEHNFDGRLNKEALDAYNTTIKPSVNNTLGIISYLDKNKDELQKQYDEYLQIKNNFDKAHQAYKNSEAEFNRLLDLVNKGKLSYNDPRFTQAFDNWLNAYNEYNALSNDITKLNDNVLNIASGITDKDKGLGYTNFSFVKFDDITKIDLIKPEFPDIDNSQGGNLPDFEQTASLNLIGDKALDEEEETEEVEEASLNQKNKACIVSDNFKTMNPCIVGGL
ncbi:filamentous hemagglutinin N-terminal domain-containing protein [Campylobacter lari]|nr:filamentous hemagglutinin N-terminal domain-containing protein [Campylobacter lari]